MSNQATKQPSINPVGKEADETPNTPFSAAEGQIILSALNLALKSTQNALAAANDILTVAQKVSQMTRQK